MVPCYNEENQIGNVIETMPEFVDLIVITDDNSKDNSKQVIEEKAKGDPRIRLLKHEKQQGNGMARVTGLNFCVKLDEIDIVCMMDGDGQMDPDELHLLLEPIINDEADYTKGNRFFSREAWEVIPRNRYLGNAMLSLVTKMVSGYWHIADSQTGYIVVKKDILKRIDLNHLYKDYGFPNDLLIHANVANARVTDVPITPLYNIGEKSLMKIWKSIPRISWLLFRRFFWRMKEKYIIRDFHPLVLFYFFGFFLLLLSIPLVLRMFYMWYINGLIPKVNALAVMFTFISGFQAVLFAMWFDMDYNKKSK